MKHKKLIWALAIISTILFFLAHMLQGQLNGKHNSIPGLDHKTVSAIHLQPSEPAWKVNLVAKDLVISNKQQIETITGLLRKTALHIPSHPVRVWETKMIFITTSKERVEIEIHKNNNDYNGTVIQTPLNNYRMDEIGTYLEKLTKYRQPVYGDTVKPKS